MPRGNKGVAHLTPSLVVAATLVLAAQAPPAPGQAPGAPQPPQSMKGAVLKGKAPVSNDILKVALPKPQEADLPNGAHVMVLEDRRVPIVSLEIVIPGAGGYFDPADQPGLATFTASMMREGTASRSSSQISEQLETIAATLVVGSGMSSEDATVSGSALSERFGELLDLAADVVLHPSFPQEELDRYKQRTLAALLQQRSNPNFLAGEMSSRVVFGSHPASRISPSAAALKGLTRDPLVAFHRARYVPDHAIVAVSGDISLPEAMKALTAKLGAWQKTGRERPAVKDPEAIGGARVYLVARPRSVQTNLIVATQAINRTSADYDIVSVMNRVIGGGPTGRLFMNLREEKGFTYGAYSSVNAPRYRGSWEASTDVRTEVTEPALKEIIGEIRRLRDEPVSGTELANAKRAMVANFALSLESAQAVLNRHVTRRRFGLPADYWDKYPERVMNVTAEQVQAAARKYLDASRLQIVAVGDAEKIAGALKQFGALEQYDTEGKPVAPPLP